MIRVVTYLAIAVVALAADNLQPLDVKTGLWQIDESLSFNGQPGEKESRTQCITAKQLTTVWGKGENFCNWTVLKSTRSDLEARGTSCGPGKNAELEAKVHRLDSEHTQGTLHGNVKEANATLDINYTGKWLSATCPAGTNE
jgi:hypothetical protein